MRRGRRPWLALIAVVLTVVLDVVGGGCLPLLSRDPRVTSGASGRVSGAVPIRAHRDSISGGAPVPDPIDASLSYGWSPDLDRYPAFELTLSAPAGLIFLPQPEAYIQLPRALSGPLDVGAGVSYVWFQQTTRPYVAVGLLDQRGNGPLLLAGYSNRAYPFYGRTDNRGSVLAATLGYQLAADRGTNQLFVQGIVARHDERCVINAPCIASTRSWIATVGASHEVSFTRHP